MVVRGTIAFSHFCNLYFLDHGVDPLSRELVWHRVLAFCHQADRVNALLPNRRASVLESSYVQTPPARQKGGIAACLSHFLFSIFSVVADSKYTPRLSKSMMIFIRSGKLRPRRSKRQTTNVSPVRNTSGNILSMPTERQNHPILPY